MTDAELLELYNSTLAANPRRETTMTVSADALYDITQDLMACRARLYAAANEGHMIKVARVAEMLPINEEADRQVTAALNRRNAVYKPRKLTIPALAPDEAALLVELVKDVRDSLDRTYYAPHLAVLDRLLSVGGG